MAGRDHASLVTHRNRNLASTTVINSSQRRTCATMLALTSHYMATNAKHPRYAPGSFGWLATRCNQRGVTGCEKRFAAGWGLRSVSAWLAPGGVLGWRSGFARATVGVLGWRLEFARAAVGVPGGAGGVRGRLGRDGAGGVDLAEGVRALAYGPLTAAPARWPLLPRRPRQPLPPRRGSAGKSDRARTSGPGGVRGEMGGVGAYGLCGRKVGFGAGRDIRRVRRWRGRGGRDATAACNRSMRQEQ